MRSTSRPSLALLYARREERTGTRRALAEDAPDCVEVALLGGGSVLLAHLDAATPDGSLHHLGGLGAAHLGRHLLEEVVVHERSVLERRAGLGA